MKRTLLFLTAVFLALLGISSFFWFDQVKFFIGRANISQATFSVDNSYLFVSPLRAQANNQEEIRVTVFILNNQGLGVLGRKVVLENDPALTFKSSTVLTDDLGKAIFDISATKSGEYYLQVKVDDKSLSQKAHLSFY